MHFQNIVDGRCLKKNSDFCSLKFTFQILQPYINFESFLEHSLVNTVFDLNFSIYIKEHFLRFLPKKLRKPWMKLIICFANFQILGPLGCQGWAVMSQNVKRPKSLHPTLQCLSNLFQHKVSYTQWGNMEAGLAGWRKMTRPGKICWWWYQPLSPTHRHDLNRAMYVCRYCGEWL